VDADGRLRDGSPLVAAKWAQRVRIERRYPVVRCLNVEADRENFAELERNLAPWREVAIALPGEFADHVDDIIETIGTTELLHAFIHNFPDRNRPGSSGVVLGRAIILALFIVLHPRVRCCLLNLALRLLKRNPIQLTVRDSDILLITLAWCASWIVAGSAFYVLLLALWPSAPLVALPICIGIYALAWDIGFVSFITPSGLGFREGAIVGLFALSLPLPAGLAPIIAILSRFVSTIAELVCVGIAYLSGGRQARSIQQEQAVQQTMIPPDTLPTRDVPTNEKTQEKDMKTISVEASTGASVEEGMRSE